MNHNAGLPRLQTFQLSVARVPEVIGSSSEEEVGGHRWCMGGARQQHRRGETTADPSASPLCVTSAQHIPSVCWGCAGETVDGEPHTSLLPATQWLCYFRQAKCPCWTSISPSIKWVLHRVAIQWENEYKNNLESIKQNGNITPAFSRRFWCRYLVSWRKNSVASRRRSHDFSQVISLVSFHSPTPIHPPAPWYAFKCP